MICCYVGYIPLFTFCHLNRNRLVQSISAARAFDISPTQQRQQSLITVDTPLNLINWIVTPPSESIQMYIEAFCASTSIWWKCRERTAIMLIKICLYWIPARLFCWFSNRIFPMRKTIFPIFTLRANLSEENMKGIRINLINFKYWTLNDSYLRNDDRSSSIRFSYPKIRYVYH